MSWLFFLGVLPLGAASSPEKCIIVVGAHADDVEQIAGATFAKHLAQGYKGVYVVLANEMTANVIGREDQPADALEAIQHRTENALDAASYYGAVPVFFNFFGTRIWHGREVALTGSPLWSRFLPPGAGDISSSHFLQIRTPILKLIRHYNPELVITHCFGQGDIEHHSAAHAVHRAWRDAKGGGARLGQLWFQAGDDRGMISESSFRRFFEPTRISVEVTDYVDKMFEASAFHRHNDYEERKRRALQGQGFDPERRRPCYFEHFFVVADATDPTPELQQESDRPLAPPFTYRPSQQPPVVMAVGAHSDDIEVQVGGTFTRLIRQGWKGVYVIATNNTAGCQIEKFKPSSSSSGAEPGVREPQPIFPSDALETIQIRQEEGRSAAALLGAEPHFLDLHEATIRIGRRSVYMADEAWGAYNAPGYGLITSSPDAKGVELLAALIARCQPDLVMTHLFGHPSAEHTQTADLAYRAFERAAAEGAQVGQFWMPVGRQLQYLERVRLKPDVSVDVTEYIQLNWRALALHVSQNGGIPRKAEPGRRYYEHFIIVSDHTNRR